MANKLLVCAATRRELETFRRDGETWPLDEAQGTWCADLGPFAVAVTGVGIPHTMLQLPALLSRCCPDQVLNIGIAGAYPSSGLQIGDIAMARSEIIGDIGFELPDAPGFQSIVGSPFGDGYSQMPMTMAPAFRQEPAGYRFHEVDACTVNACTGTHRTGLLREQLFGVGTESMEGAAVALACDAAGIPACEVRAISNIAADREMLPANIGLALENLRTYLLACRMRQGI